MKVSMTGESCCHSMWSHLKHGGAGSEDGDASNLVMGTWSESYPSGNSLHNYARGICHHRGEHISEPKLPE